MKPAFVVGALVFVAAGTMHFVAPGAYLKIMPPALPAKELLVAISGAAEIAGGLGLLVPALRFSAAMGLIALLVAVFPANIYMATDAAAFASFAPAWALWARLPIQVFLIAWVWGLRK